MKMGRKVKTSIALDEELLAWIDEMIDRKRFASRTHAVEYALQRLREQQEEELHIVCANELLNRH
jgi:Arc/MetJ-type ribon-helix-helix transcriptional regulator